MRWGALLPALALALCGCAEMPAAPPGESVPRMPTSAGDAANLVEGTTQFGLDLYRQAAADGGNVFLSPPSVSTALAMVHAGAEGETAAEMARTLHFPAGGEVHADMGALLRQLPLDAPGRVVRIANALWVQQDFPLRPEYRRVLTELYASEADAVDYIRAPDAAVATINAWAEEKTAGRIKGLLVRRNITELTRLILTNSVYFKGDWLRPFDAGQTGQRPFRLADGRSIPATFMRQRGAFRMLDGAGFEALEAPYKGEELSMILFVPERPDGLAAFEASLTSEKLAGWIDALRAQAPQDVEWVMPKLQLTTKASLVPMLKALGMRRAFTDDAELRGIAPAELRVADVIHQTFLLVDEKGTEAAAATAALIEIESMPRAFHADRPFFFAIRDNRSGAILFMGRIVDPTAD